VLTAVDAGALWVWGPTCDADGANAWELPLPAWWEELWPELARRRLVLATGHLDAAGRRRFAEACAGLPEVTCSLTHSLFLADGEVEALAATGCAFELDCYTRTVAIPGHTAAPVARRASRIRELGCLVHLTSDGGQASTSDPFRFAAAELEKLRPECGDELVYALAREGPERLAARLGLGDGHDRGDT
jgi:hypothetical protein